MTFSSQSELIHNIRFVFDQHVKMQDGVDLSVDLLLPRAPGPFPTIFLRTPYENSSRRFLERGLWWARNGYAFVSGDCRGRYESGGTFTPYHPDASDGQDTLEWISKQSWSNGKIGMAGQSYGAIIQWLTAPFRHPSLKALAPHVICDEYFSNCHYVGGAFQLGLSIMAAVTFSTNPTIPEISEVFDHGKTFGHLPLIDMDLETIGQKIPFYRQWLEHSTYDDYWQTIDTSKQYNQIDVPVFIRAGWFDAYPDAAFRMWNGMRENARSEQSRNNQKLIIGPWTHAEPTGTKLGDLDFGPDSYRVILEEELRWFNYWLKGVDNRLLEEPPIHLFVMGTNHWRYEHEWPLARTQFTPYYFHSQGQANSSNSDGILNLERPTAEPTDQYQYDPEKPVPSIGGNLSTASWPWTEQGENPIVAGPVDQRTLEKRPDVLVYTSSQLEKDLEVTGPLKVVLFATSTALDTDFTARLVDVYPDGNAIFLAEGIRRARFRNGFEKQELLKPNKVERYCIELYPTSNVFLKGHRIRVDISSSNFPRFSRNLNTGEDVGTGTRMQIAHQTIFHDRDYPSHIILPLIPE